MMQRKKTLLFLALFIYLFLIYWWFDTICARIVQPFKDNIFIVEELMINSSVRMNKSRVQLRRTVLHIRAQFKPTALSKPPKLRNITIVERLEKIDAYSVSMKLPKLTKKAQDEYYGRGCKENRNKKRLQVLLHVWENIAARRNISQYFLCFGSYLGSIRNKDIVPYDSDMDVCMLRHDYHKLYQEESQRPLNLNDGKIHLLLQRHSPHPKPKTPRKNCKGKIVRKKVDACSILDPHARLFLGRKVYLDIFMIEDHGAKLWDEYRNRIHTREVIFPVKPCEFLGIDTRCPNSVVTYLRPYYGRNYMKPHHVCKNGTWVKNVPNARKRLI